MSGTFKKLRDKTQSLIDILRNTEGHSGRAGVLGDMVRKRARAARLAWDVRHLHGPRRPPGGARDVVALCSLRDGAEFIRHFLRHHRRIGVRHFVFLDNGSQDDTCEILAREDDVTLYASELPYAAYKHLFKRFLVRTCGRDRWSLLVDIDECFDFPGSDRIDLPSFCDYLDRGSHDAVVAHMVDMFPSDRIVDVPEAPDGNLARIHCYFDVSALKEDDHREAFGPTNQISNPEIKCLSCGINQTVFGNDVLLTKHPLIRWKPPMELPKYSHDIAYARIADTSAALYHFKYTRSFSRVLDRALREQSYFRGSARYQRIAQVLRNKPDLSLHGPHARRLRDVGQLVDAGVLKISATYRRWLEEHAEPPPEPATAGGSPHTDSRS